jgi:hypothetical protein
MKRLLIKLVIFSIPILALIILYPINKRLKYQGLKDDCFNHGIWIHDRIFQNNTPINIVFLGSSHTINSINDELISNKTFIGNAANIGYCRLGSDLNYILLKETLTQKNPTHIIIEVREDEDRYSHPIFPYVADNKDVLMANMLFNKDILKNIWTHFAYNIEMTQDILYKQQSHIEIKTNNFGFSPIEDTASSEVLEIFKRSKAEPKTSLTTLENDFHENFSRVYLKKIYDLCKGENKKIFFLFIPSYGTDTNIEKPKEYDTYIKYGAVLIPPNEIFSNKKNWHDEHHLNKSGANELSLWLITKINNN